MHSPESPSQDLQALQREVQELRRRLRVSQEIDDLIEAGSVAQKCLSALLEEIFSYIEKEMQPAAIFLRTIDEELKISNFCRGIAVKDLTPDEQTAFGGTDRRKTLVSGQRTWFITGLDMAGENIGIFALAFPTRDCPAQETTYELMHSIIEELDNYFYAIKANRFKHMMIMEIQHCLKSKNLAEAIDRAVNMIGDAVPIQDLFLLYLDEDLEGKSTLQYLVYHNMAKAYDSTETPHAELDALIKAGKQLVLPGNRDLEHIFPVDGTTETVLLDGLVVETLVGKMLIRPPQGIGLSVSSREIVQVFGESLRQRLVDFNREKNSLQQYFSPEVTRQLLKFPDYKERFMSPRKAEIGILFADISGFTKLSEQVLKDPERIAVFIDRWSHGVVEQVFTENGSLDKIVGDCVIGLFGPPFYSREPAQWALHTLLAACRIRTFTREFLASPENRDIQNSPFYKDFGVATGVNLTGADVGMIGPNKDLTAFSSGMNNTARLQGLAHAGEILVTPIVKDLVEKIAPGRFQFSGPFATQVKNVKEPLPYFKLDSES